LGFPRLMSEIIACWSEGCWAVRGAGLRQRVEAAGTPRFDDPEWEGMLASLSLPYIDGSINLLLFSWESGVYVINHAGAARFLESSAGSGWLGALEGMLGIRVPPLRAPARGLESQWTAWLDSVALACRPACFGRYAPGAH
jgi:hypothetical protein